MHKLKLFFLLITLPAFFSASIAQTTTRIFVVRHADRESTDDLNPAGVIRANELKRVLLNTGIDSIFSTDFVRTKKTVRPLADAENLPVVLYDSNPRLLKRILSFSKGKTLLVAGHSNTVPKLIKLCGCTVPFDNIPDNQFDNLFLLIIQHQKTKTVVKNTCKLLYMKYGAVTD
jgi:2,3-bisphosphoglycerate-dependent phosphoglycerate mutase